MVASQSIDILISVKAVNLYTIDEIFLNTFILKTLSPIRAYARIERLL